MYTYSITIITKTLSVEEEAAAAAMIRRLDFEESSLRQLQSGWGGYTTCANSSNVNMQVLCMFYNKSTGE